MIPSPEGEAVRILEEHGIGVPVPIESILEELGVRLGGVVVPEDRTRAVVGMSAGHRYIMRNDWWRVPGQVRFTLAHELGHLLLWEALGDERIPRQWAEIWCQRFAAALLMPAGQVKRLRIYGRDVQLHRVFGVSRTAMEYRLRQIDRAARQATLP